LEAATSRFFSFDPLKLDQAAAEAAKETGGWFAK